MALLQKGQTQLRLKCHELLDTICGYFINFCASKTVYGEQKPQNEVDLITQERLLLIQTVYLVVKNSLENNPNSSD